MFRPLQTLKKLLINLLKSVAFLTSFVMSIYLFQCYGTKICKSISISKIKSWVIHIIVTLHKISCLTSGFGIAFEQPHKRVDITYFCLPKTFEAIWNMLEKRHFVKTLPKQEVIYRVFTIINYRWLYSRYLSGYWALFSKMGETQKGTHSRHGWVSGGVATKRKQMYKRHKKIR